MKGDWVFLAAIGVLVASAVVVIVSVMLAWEGY